MIPRKLRETLRALLSQHELDRRRIEEEGRVYVEFGGTEDSRLLERMGIQVDTLGPEKVIFLWDETSELEIGGYLVLDNLSRGRPALGGIRMQPEITPQDIAFLARGMTLKNAAAQLDFGGGKAGIIADRARLTDAEREEVIRTFARLLRRYTNDYIPGPDVGTNDEDMALIAIENGLDNAVSKPVRMGGNAIDASGAAAEGVVVAIETILEQWEKLRVLPQFRHQKPLRLRGATVIIQGFGAVGAHVARLLAERGAKIIGISDREGYLYCAEGLAIDRLLRRQEEGVVTDREYMAYYHKPYEGKRGEVKFSNARDELLRESADIFIPASPKRDYLQLYGQPLDLSRVGRWRLIVEGANTYSSREEDRKAREALETALYKEQGTFLATDYLVNAGGVIFAAFEKLEQADRCLPPRELLGNREAIEDFLQQHATEIAEIASARKQRAHEKLTSVIRQNIRELIEELTRNPDLLPCQAAEMISRRRIRKLVKDVLSPKIKTIQSHVPIKLAAQEMTAAEFDLVAVLSEDNRLIGVVTPWDISRAIAEDRLQEEVAQIMAREPVVARRDETVQEAALKLKEKRISAMPVVDEHGQVIGIVTASMLAALFVER
ncbi:MAG: CBS domain-containing protein [Nitrospinota bacterium]|nr:MAG: CBS domain-containing protein [Nitrospinota bacterium]